MDTANIYLQPTDVYVDSKIDQLFDGPWKQYNVIPNDNYKTEFAVDHVSTANFTFDDPLPEPKDLIFSYAYTDLNNGT